MACFLVPAAEAIVTVAASKISEKKTNEQKAMHSDAICEDSVTKVPFFRKLKWLVNLLMGGSVLLAFEHLWHGEIVPWFPFLTAAGDAAATSEMLHEMATVGVAMAVLCTAIWGAMLVVSSVIEKRAAKQAESEKA